MNEDLKATNVEETTTQPAQQAAQNNKDHDWRELRAAIERERQERIAETQRREAAERRLAEIAQAKQESEESLGADDDYIEAKHFKKLQREVKETRQQLKERQEREQQERQQNELWRTEMTLRSQFNDYNDVMTSENLAQLEEKDPIMARVLHDSQDEYAKRVGAYNLIKRMKQQNAPSPEAAINAQKLEENASKIRPAASMASQSASVSPLRQASKYTGQAVEGEYKRWLQEQVARDSKNVYS